MKERRTSVLHDLAGLSFDVELMSEFDAAGNRTDLKALVNGTADFWNEYLYDDLHRTTSIEQHGAAGGSTVAEKRIDFAYDAASQWDTITRYANLLGTQLVAESTYAFDDAGRLVSLAHAKGTSVFADYAWTYDAANRITAFTNGVHASENVTYAYDDADQLTGADRSGSTNDETYSYDANGNRTNTGYATGDGNELESDGVYNYENDDEGNRTKRTHIASGDYVEYEWDYRNRLTGIRFKTPGHALTKQVEYEYDVQDRRTVKRVDANADSTYETIFHYLYDEQDIVLVYDGSGSLTNRYLHGPAVDQILADENAIGDVLWPLADNQGTVRDVAEYDALTDTTSIVKHLAYSAFGAITHDTAPTLTFLYAYTGREWDADAGLYYYRARWYDPHTGRFLSRDPIGFAAGDANDMRYVGNSPANFTDPSGLISYAPKDGIPPEEIVNLLGLPQEMLAGIDPTKMDPVGDAVQFWQLVMFYYDGGRGGYSLIECIQMAQSVLIGQELGFTQLSDAFARHTAERGRVQSTGERWFKGITGGVQIVGMAFAFGRFARAAKGIPVELNVSSKQFGPKMAARSVELGLNPNDPRVRYQMRGRIQRIFDNADEVRRGTFRGQGPNNTEGSVLFFRRGHDVVVTSPCGDFVTLLICGIKNQRFINGVPMP